MMINNKKRVEDTRLRATIMTAALSVDLHQRVSNDTVITIEFEKLVNIMHSQIALDEMTIKEDVVGTIYSIANDLANNDPKALGSISLTPYFGNAVAIYSEYLKGDNYERIDWRALHLPTLEKLSKVKEEIHER